MEDELTFMAVVVVDLGDEMVEVAGLRAGPGGGAPRLVQHHVALTTHCSSRTCRTRTRVVASTALR